MPKDLQTLARFDQLPTEIKRDRDHVNLPELGLRVRVQELTGREREIHGEYCRKEERRPDKTWAVKDRIVGQRAHAIVLALIDDDGRKVVPLQDIVDLTSDAKRWINSIGLWPNACIVRVARRIWEMSGETDDVKEDLGEDSASTPTVEAPSDSRSN